jgi:hypothetical protein
MDRSLLSVLLLVIVLTACNTAPIAVPPTAPTATTTMPATLTLPAPTPTMPGVPGVSWTRQRFAKAWDLEYPEGWTVNSAGIQEGNLSLSGTYDSHAYEVRLFYPIFQRPEAMANLDTWIQDELAPLPPAQRGAVQVRNTTVAGTPAKKLLSLPEKISDDGTTRRYSERLTHAAYIWRRNEQNPSIVVIKQTDGQPLDARQMEAVLDRLLAGIK